MTNDTICTEINIWSIRTLEVSLLGMVLKRALNLYVLGFMKVLSYQSMLLIPLLYIPFKSVDSNP